MKGLNVKLCFLPCLLLGITSHLHLVSGAAVMSVDLGSEWLKVAYISPGVPMEMALNEESQRKTPVAICFRGVDRIFGEAALSLSTRFPSNCFYYFLDLLGKNIDNPIIKLYKKRFPQINLKKDETRGTVLFQIDENTAYSSEELVSMILYNAKQYAETSSGQKIKDVVITVPGYFNQAERKSLLKAAEMADLKVLQLMNDYTAVALHYGLFRSNIFNETSQYVMIYDMGAYSTTATIISYQMVKIKEKGYTDTVPQLSVIGVGYDRTLGGLEFQLLLKDYITEKFAKGAKDKKGASDINENNYRAHAKLLKEAGRVKKILTTNTEHVAQIESLLDGSDLKLEITRKEFEDISKDAIARAEIPIYKALEKSGLTMDVISQVVLMGGGTRVPAIKNMLSNIAGDKISKSLNTDEAAAMGAVYRAAGLSPLFKVKKFIVKDAVLFAIMVVFDKEQENKQVKRTLFNVMNPYPQKKIITFNKHYNDFSFIVRYGELAVWPENEIQAIGSHEIKKVTLTGVSDAVNKHQGPDVDPKGIKVHFNVDDSGILQLTGVQYTLEKAAPPPETTFEKISSTFTKLFSGSEDKEEKPVTEENLDDKKENVAQNKTEEALNATETNKTQTAEEPVKKVKTITVKETISSIEDDLHVKCLDTTQLQKSIDKINKLNQYDNDKKKREEMQNALETMVINTKAKSNSEELFSFATEEETQQLISKSLEISDWLENEGFDADLGSLESRLSELSSLSNPVEKRRYEFDNRQSAITTIEGTLNGSSFFLESIKNNTKTGVDEMSPFSIFTETEVITLENIINETKDWLAKKRSIQDGLRKFDEPAMKVEEIMEKGAALDREVRYLISKSKSWKPPKPKATKDKVKKEKEEVKEEVNAEEDVKVEEVNTEEGMKVVEEVINEEANISPQEEVINDQKKNETESHVEL